MNETVNAPAVYDIGRGSFVDGPGIRSVVFFTGCPLRCRWCHNPESWALSEGRGYAPDELAGLLAKDAVFFEVSKGGVTFSGGEPMLYPGYLLEVCARLRTRGIHTAVETSGFWSETEQTVQVVKTIDLFLFDLKIIDRRHHRTATGQDNALILGNLESLVRRGRKVAVTIPLVPGFTATEANLDRIARKIVHLGIKEYFTRPYNPSGIGKRKKLGLPDAGGLSERPISLEEEQAWNTYLRQRITVHSNSGAFAAQPLSIQGLFDAV